MTVRIGPKLKAADVQRMLFTTSEPQVQPPRHMIFKALPRLPFVVQDQMADFSIYLKKEKSPVRMFSAVTLACTSSECSEVYVISALT